MVQMQSIRTEKLSNKVLGQPKNHDQMPGPFALLAGY
jgi:hypothetical protein